MGCVFSSEYINEFAAKNWRYVILVILVQNGSPMQVETQTTMILSFVVFLFTLSCQIFVCRFQVLHFLKPNWTSSWNLFCKYPSQRMNFLKCRIHIRVMRKSVLRSKAKRRMHSSLCVSTCLNSQKTHTYTPVCVYMSESGIVHSFTKCKHQGILTEWLQWWQFVATIGPCIPNELVGFFARMEIKQIMHWRVYTRGIKI